MADERERRMLGAADSITVNGKDFKLRPVVAQHLSDLEQLALSTFKRNYLKTYRDNLDLLPPPEREGLMAKKLAEVAVWDLKDLPYKQAYDASRVPINDALTEWLVEHYGELPKTDKGIIALVDVALDTDEITSDEVKALTEKAPIQGRVRYDQWWVTASINGMISMIASSIKQDHPETSTKDVSQWPFPKLVEASRKAESVSSASMGNG
jgi:hypothetical protein